MRLSSWGSSEMRELIERQEMELISLRAERAEAYLDLSKLMLQMDTLRARVAELERALRVISLMDKRHEHDLFSATCVARAALAKTGESNER
jgi:outer membrane protein TolC